MEKNAIEKWRTSQREQGMATFFVYSANLSEPVIPK
jgi:hypothetical protein